MSEIKAILFDMDGVLVEAKDWHYEALNRALDLFGYAIDRDAHLTTYDGLPTRKKLQMLTKSKGLPKKLHEFLNTLKQSYTIEMAAAKCKPVFNVKYALATLQRDGYRMAVCSNSVRSSVENMMSLSGLADHLELMVSNEDVHTPKPDPAMYLHAMKVLNVTPDECIILEDNEHGIAAAKASGARVMIVDSPNDVTYSGITSFISSLKR